MVPRLIIDAGSSDFIACVRLLLTSRDADRASIDAKLNALLAAKGNGRAAVAGLSLRTLFDAWLQHLGTSGGGEILFSAATIEDMPALAEANGFRAVPADVRLDTMVPGPADVRKLMTPATRALVVAQLYGCRSDLSGLAEACRERGVLLVEDIAQSFDGNYLGSPHADLVFMSFGPIKRFTAFGGGVLLAAGKAHAGAVQERLNGYPVSSSAHFFRRVLKMLCLRMGAWRPLYSLLWSAIRLTGKQPDTVISGLARGFPGQRPDVFRFRPCAAQLAFLAHRFEIALRSEDTGRREMARRARSRDYRGLRVPGRNVPGMGEWLLPALAGKPERLVAYLNRRGYDATRGTTSMRAIVAADGANAARSTVAEQLLGSAVYLPLHALKSDREFLLLASTVDEGADNLT